MGQTLSARQEMFARAFALRGAIAPAYQEAFPEEGASNATAYKKGRELLQSQGVKARARQLRDQAALDVRDATRALATYLIDVLQAPRDVVQHRRGACRYCHGVGHRYQWRLSEYLDAVDAAQLAGNPPPLADGGFDYDEAAAPCADCPHCRGRGVGYTYVKDTTELTPEEEAAFEGVELTQHGLKAKYASKSEAAAALMKLYGLGADNVRVLFQDQTPQRVEAPEMPSDPRKAAEVYREFMAGRLTLPSQAG